MIYLKIKSIKNLHILPQIYVNIIKKNFFFNNYHREKNMQILLQI